jgi:alanyl-tRNA synthetase
MSWIYNGKEFLDKMVPEGAVGFIYEMNAIIDGKVGLCAVVSDDLVKEKKLSAGKIAGDVAKILGGGGGGKPHLATAGGKDVTKIDEALDALPGIIKKYL